MRIPLANPTRRRDASDFPAAQLTGQKTAHYRMITAAAVAVIIPQNRT